ncbi:M24 family metallopeptidase [Olsenella massiliensis]|uniref:M24 family metallopeptidase n=1 Tax=Olsenella massiliensis TaxID=1622075 RepID=UPI00071CAB8A|nr:aminopeptidase P family protein [Olsenella massiliensis]
MTSTITLERRLAKLRGLMGERGYDAVVLRNNPDLRWLTGAERCFDDEVAHVALVTPDGLWLHTDSRYFNGLRERMGADGPWSIDMDGEEAPRWAARRILQARARVVAVEDSVSVSFVDALQVCCAELGVACLLPRLHEDVMALRMVKDEEEIARMREAQAITDAAFEHICGYIKAGMTELAVRAELESFMLSHGADALSFETIVAAGANGANPHARPSAYVIQKGDMVVMDYGAGLGDYHSDMTRTVCVGACGALQREVYDAVRRAHETCAREARPGCLGSDVHRRAVEVISEAGYGDYFKHGLGHGVGLQIHEQPNFGRSWDKPVPEGSVVTIEPGIYLPGQFGVRLEDFGVMRHDGYHAFTASTHDLVIVG